MYTLKEDIQGEKNLYTFKESEVNTGSTVKGTKFYGVF